MPTPPPEHPLVVFERSPTGSTRFFLTLPFMAFFPLLLSGSVGVALVHEAAVTHLPFVLPLSSAWLGVFGTAVALMGLAGTRRYIALRYARAEVRPDGVRFSQTIFLDHAQRKAEAEIPLAALSVVRATPWGLVCRAEAANAFLSWVAPPLIPTHGDEEQALALRLLEGRADPGDWRAAAPPSEPCGKCGKAYPHDFGWGLCLPCYHRRQALRTTAVEAALFVAFFAVAGFGLIVALSG